MSVKKDIEVNVTAPGLKDVIVDATKANKQLDNLGKPRKVVDPRGSAASKLGPPLGGSFAEEELNSYAKQRAAVGTGAASRDFAKQAQGLGGLVHVYATFAANVFAVTAAFQALKEAANFEKITQSIRVLGDSSGTDLSALSKKLVEITDNAISTQDALKFTALASSSGITSKQMEALVKGARGASVALGRDMGDAVDRVIRGVAKLEPELLDELGVTTRAGTAFTKYAKAVGISADSLSQNTKIQVYANAVAAELADKFGVLGDSVPASAFDKFSAAIQDSGKKLLSVVAAFTGPILNVFSNSPGLLQAGLVALVAYILNKAIPAMLEFKAKGEDSFQRLQEARNSMFSKLKEQQETVRTALLEVLDDSLAKAKEAKATLISTETAAIQGIQNQTKNLSKGIRDSFKEIGDLNGLKQNAAALNKALDDYDKRLVATQTRAANLAKTGIAADDPKLLNAQKAADTAAKRLVQTAEVRKKIADAILMTSVNTSAVDAEIATVEREILDASKKIEFSGTRRIANAKIELELAKQKGKVEVANAVSAFGLTSSITKGIVEQVDSDIAQRRDAVQKVIGTVQKESTSLVGKASAAAQGAVNRLGGLFDKVGTRISGIFTIVETFAGAILRVAGVIGIAFLAFETLDSIIGLTSKEVEKLNSTLDGLEDYISRSNERLKVSTDLWSKANESITAFGAANKFAANLLEETSTKIEDATDKLAAYNHELSTNASARFFEGVKSIFGSGVEERLRTDIIKLIDTLPQNQTIKALEHLNLKSMDDLRNKLESMTGIRLDLYLKDVRSALTASSKEFRTAAESSDVLNTAITDINNAFAKLENKQASKDPNRLPIVQALQALKRELDAGSLDTTRISQFITGIEANLDQFTPAFQKAISDWIALNKEAYTAIQYAQKIDAVSLDPRINTGVSEMTQFISGLDGKIKDLSSTSNAYARQELAAIYSRIKLYAQELDAIKASTTALLLKGIAAKHQDSGISSAEYAAEAEAVGKAVDAKYAALNKNLAASTKTVVDTYSAVTDSNVKASNNIVNEATKDLGALKKRRDEVLYGSSTAKNVMLTVIDDQIKGASTALDTAIANRDKVLKDTEKSSIAALELAGDYDASAKKSIEDRTQAHQAEAKAQAASVSALSKAVAAEASAQGKISSKKGRESKESTKLMDIEIASLQRLINLNKEYQSIQEKGLGYYDAALLASSKLAESTIVELEYKKKLAQISNDKNLSGAEKSAAAKDAEKELATARILINLKYKQAALERNISEEYAKRTNIITAQIATIELQINQLKNLYGENVITPSELAGATAYLTAKKSLEDKIKEFKLKSAALITTIEDTNADPGIRDEAKKLLGVYDNLVGKAEKYSEALDPTTFALKAQIDEANQLGSAFESVAKSIEELGALGDANSLVTVTQLELSKKLEANSKAMLAAQQAIALAEGDRNVQLQKGIELLGLQAQKTKLVLEGMQTALNAEKMAFMQGTSDITNINLKESVKTYSDLLSRELQLRSYQFATSLKDPITSTVDGIISGIDKGIDEAMAELAEKGTINFSKMFRTIIAEMNAEAVKQAGEYLKQFARNALNTIFNGGSFSDIFKLPDPNKLKPVEAKTIGELETHTGLLQQIARNTANMGKYPLTGDIPKETFNPNFFKDLVGTSKPQMSLDPNLYMSAFKTPTPQMSVDPSLLSANTVNKGLSKLTEGFTDMVDTSVGAMSKGSATILGTFGTSMNTFTTGATGGLSGLLAGTTKVTSETPGLFSRLWDTISQGASSLWSSLQGGFSGLLNNIMSMFSSASLGGGGGGGLGGFGSVLGSFGSLFGSSGAAGAASGGLGSIFTSTAGSAAFDSSFSSLFSVASAALFKDGGIMTEYGKLPLQKFADGGVATSPMAAIFGEGRKPEAYVPLPDGRTIPVTMQDSSTPRESTNITNNFHISGNPSVESQNQIATKVGMSIERARIRSNQKR